ncbi:zinc finger matrin-type protein 3-like [Leguminivora glycinivorella]|uniref:zinc finger matrin-type protein 3-like n=1 Tax=Leguminivora glycinivorella TaxID=1035111 RepID=UPI00200BF662|nr:zinc finger matrin-type protein 3-like [Leguminivora glycinivorella]
MGDRNFVEDVDFGNGNGFAINKPMRPIRPPRRGMPNHDRYNNAYGSYRGGYGPGGGFGFGPRGPPMDGPMGPPPMGPPPMGRPMGPPMGPPMRPMGPRGPRGPPPPTVMYGRGFGPGASPMPRKVGPETQAYRYLLRCGIAQETLKDIPKKLLKLMEAHHCGVCGLDFDSFTMSRMHYTSRNHQKNQKKWQLQNSAKPTPGKQIPLKSRDLYCELCDVTITSTVHADSHYSGKPHRAIVEGKKKPKNPYLLQKGMEGRTEQLINREKQHLPEITETKPVLGEDSKAPHGDLYCDICKTSMTNSEQMTMHLNGKKHLSKEKQHIIRVMNAQSQNNSNDATVKQEPQDAPAEQPEGNGNDGGDWGNGSGTWEE